MINTPDRYDLEARYVPALVCSVPFLFFGYYFLNGLDGAFWHSALTLTVGSLSLSTALFFVGVHLYRTLGNVIQEKIFREGLALPSTELLLDVSTALSEDRKAKVKQLIKIHFKVHLKANLADTDLNRRLIHEAVSQIRSLVYRKNHLLQQRNIQFGFTRNLLAGSIVAFVISVVGLAISFLSRNHAAVEVAMVLLAVYLILAIVSGTLLKFTARQYALTLFNEFIANC